MISGIGTQLRKGVAEFCILGLLETAPMYGWELAARLQDMEIIASIGTLYPLLTRLRDRGSVTTVTVPSDSGPPRKYYSLTDVGRVELKRFRDQWRALIETVNNAIGNGEI